ncbi:MAG: hypothetical protein EPO32_12460 [Anaerolineae bacterium]|nr:MAG: hypothetical protein EPO32_12460 [Anaerolineae bacterium]
MGCSNFVTNQNFVQIIASMLLLTPTPGWKRVAANRQYEEKNWQPKDPNLVGRMERPITSRQTVDPNKVDYPHYNVLRDKDTHKVENYIAKGNRKTNFDAHYTYLDDQGKVQHVGAHKTAQAIIDDLEVLLKQRK